jgi:hypothetical protein
LNPNASLREGDVKGGHMATCKCGKRMSKFSSTCRDCHKANMRKCAEAHVEHELRGTCPDCGSKLVFNNSLAGTRWFQCAQFGMNRDSHGDRAKPDCGFQTLADGDLVKEILARREVSGAR